MGEAAVTAITARRSYCFRDSGSNRTDWTSNVDGLMKKLRGSMEGEVSKRSEARAQQSRQRSDSCEDSGEALQV
jgi:hypothetical protein